MKKNLISAVFCLIISAMTFAQVPQKMSYQAVVRGSDNNLVTNSEISVRISILQGSTDGEAVYTETHSATTNANGLVTIEIGDGTSSDDFSAINWANGPYFIKTETNVNGDDDYDIIGVSQLLAVPYAMYAQSAGNVPDVSGFLTEETQTLADVVSVGNSANAQLKDVTDPTDNQDAATKRYVDGLISQMLLTIDSLSQRLDSVTIAHEAILEDIDIRLGFVDERDGNHYGAIKIGSQIWMTENLRYEGNIPLGSETSYTTAYRYYPDNNSSNVATYGYLYNWPAAMNGASSSSANPSGVQGICPNGWHLPSKAEWSQLTTVLGGDSTAGAMLAGNASAWENGTLTNSEYFGTIGFGALPAGYSLDYYRNFGHDAHFWTSTEYDNGNAYYRSIHYNYTYIGEPHTDHEDYGFSVRCVRD
ncbi:MAG: hypothetical protein IK025_08335 [Bacteroidales bacterium]|nr:hypothetical protein [Bacteroidales bacterium]